MQRFLVIDPYRCDGCRACMSVCSLYHVGECNPAKSLIQVVKEETEGIATPVTCLQCERAVCVAVCPMNAMYRDSKTGAVMIDEKTCIGCRLCIYACPVNAPIYDPERGVAVKCDLCGGKPLCVEVCSRDAISYIPADQLGARLKRVKARKITEFQSQMASTLGG